MALFSVSTMPRIDHDQNHDPWRDLRPIRPHRINTSSSTLPPPQPPSSESSPKSRTLETEVSCTSSSGSGKVGDLIQMWRELEAETTISPTNKANQQHLVFEERSGSWETCDDATGWESDLTVESEKEHGSGKKTDQGLLRWKIVEMDKAFAGVGILDGNHLLKVRGRQITQKLFAKFEGERKNEIHWIKEKRSVSGFAYRKKINNFLRYKSMQNKKAVQNLRPQSTAQELDQLNCRIPILLLRQQFSPRPMPSQSCPSPSPLKEKICLDSKCGEIRQQHLSSGHLPTCKSVPVSENKNMSASQFSIDSFNSEQQETCESRSSAVDNKSGGFEVSQSNSDFSAENHQADIQLNLDDIIQAEEDYLPSESEDLQEGCRHLDISWENGSPKMGTVDWEGPSGQDEPYMDHNQQIEEADGMWLTDVCRSHIVLEGYREAMYTNLRETYSDNSELRQLLERRTVTTSLSSDFPVKLNKLMLSCLQSRRLAENEENTIEGYEENTIEEDEIQPVQTHDPGLVDDEQPVQIKDPGLVDDDALIEMDVVHLVLDMRTQIANVHNEISQLRKLVACCMQRNTLQYSIQEDTYLRRSASSGNTLSSQWEPVKKGNCNICYGKQVDSLIYRCGHMCTCFECATELQWSSGRCPVCKTPIIDVVRAYSPS